MISITSPERKENIFIKEENRERKEIEDRKEKKEEKLR